MTIKVKRKILSGSEISVCAFVCVIGIHSRVAKLTVYSLFKFGNKSSCWDLVLDSAKMPVTAIIN